MPYYVRIWLMPVEMVVKERVSLCVKLKNLKGVLRSRVHGHVRNCNVHVMN